MDRPVAFAHTPGADGRWHPLKTHLEDTATRARAFAEPFGAGDLAYWVGLWHDLGKFNPAFQRYLVAQDEGRSSPKVRHAVWGAALAYSCLWKAAGRAEAWKEVALPIAGHHT